MNNDIYAISLNIILSKDIINHISDLQSLIYKKYTDLRNRDNSPHLAVCTKFMEKTQIDKYVEILKENITKFKSFNINFTNFAISGKYILLDLDKESQDKILEINQKVKDLTKDIGMETVDGLPSKYPNIPHISVVKLEEENVSKALELIQNKVE